jgi:uncharacterized radical SAM superfamily protein
MGSNLDSRDLFRQPWPQLQQAAWEVRQRYHSPTLSFAVPGAKRYDTEHYTNDPRHFASISLTATRCAQQCEHCRGQLLTGMMPAASPMALLSLAQQLQEHGCQGMLLSGGADEQGAVPLKRYLPAIAQLKERGMQVIVHTGLLDLETAEGLREANVDQVLLDIVGDRETIRQVLHLDCTPDDYARTLEMLRSLQIPVAPHIVAGLHFGQLRGELRAMEIVHNAGADVLVLVVLRPLLRTPMAGVESVDPETVGRLAAVARLLAPSTPLTLGCARPARNKIETERRAVLAGVNVVAYPDPQTVQLAAELGLAADFAECCCTLAIQRQ